MAQKQKCFYVRTIATRSVRRGEVMPLALIGFCCPECKGAWKVELVIAGKKAVCEKCHIEAYDVKVNCSDPQAARGRSAVTNKKGHRMAS